MTNQQVVTEKIDTGFWEARWNDDSGKWFGATAEEATNGLLDHTWTDQEIVDWEAKHCSRK